MRLMRVFRVARVVPFPWDGVMGIDPRLIQVHNRPTCLTNFPDLPQTTVMPSNDVIPLHHQLRAALGVHILETDVLQDFPRRGLPNVRQIWYFLLATGKHLLNSWMLAMGEEGMDLTSNYTPRELIDYNLPTATSFFNISISNTGECWALLRRNLFTVETLTFKQAQFVAQLIVHKHDVQDSSPKKSRTLQIKDFSAAP